MGHQDPLGKTEEAEAATGAVDLLWPGRRSSGPPYLHLRRHHGWQIETTFQEARAYLGLETTRGRKRETVLRAAPALLGLYTLVSLWYWQLPGSVKEDWGVLWTGKEALTFSDAMTAVRRWLWSGWILPTGGHDATFAKLPNALREVLLTALAPAA
jgi:hypothetical protein